MSRSRLLVLSDFHLLMRYSRGEELLDRLHPELEQSTHCVLNGDLFDFYLSSQPTARAMEDALLRLKTLCRAYPGCEFHYVMGNHDNVDAFVERVRKLDAPNLAFHEDYYRLGDALFTHGHLYGSKDPLHDALDKLVSRGLDGGMVTPKHAGRFRLGAPLYYLEKELLRRARGRIGLDLSPADSAAKMHDNLNQRLDGEVMAAIRHVFSGHTHTKSLSNYH